MPQMKPLSCCLVVFVICVLTSTGRSQVANLKVVTDANPLIVT